MVELVPTGFQLFRACSVHKAVDPRTASVAGYIDEDAVDCPSIACNNVSMARDITAGLSMTMVVSGGVV